MTQPDKPVSARGARPQLFGDPGPGKPGSPRQPDFGPSILATIDGTPPRRDTRSRDATPLKRVLWMSAMALGVVAVYFAVKFGMLPGETSSSDAPMASAPAPVPVVKAVEPASPAEPVRSVAHAASEGAASIENVAVVSAAPASSVETTMPPANVTASLNSIEQALARAEPSEPRKPAKPTTSKEKPAPAKAPPVAATRGVDVPSPAPKPAGKSVNDDADLLAAMLPHLKRRGVAPTSPAYERRCGHLTGDAAADCRVKFCNGREGVDAACPSAVSR
ncbi:MAG TPA: hypothetical protein VGD46_04085 [Rhizobacter sp.]